MAEEKRIPPAVIVVGLGLGAAVALTYYAVARAAVPTPPPGLANLYGKVTDAVTGQPIFSVLVTLNGMQVYTNSRGDYIFPDLDPGEYMLQFSKEGYQTEVF